MKRETIIVSEYLLFVLLCLCCASNADDTRTLSVCEALSHASEYNGKFVRIRGPVGGTDEGAWFKGEGCDRTFKTGEKVWPNLIAWTMPSQARQMSAMVQRSDASLAPEFHNYDFDFDWASDERVKKKWAQLRRRYSDECIAVTYYGMFETHTDWSRFTVRNPGGSTEVSGFGHLGGAPAQLILKSADDVEVIPHCEDNGKRSP